MGRPKIDRIIRTLPNFIYFKPQGIPMRDLSEVILTIAEFEALRLKHYKDFNQVQCADKMKISQSTFSRILESAHKKITTAIVEGKAIKLEGGNYGLRELFLGYGCTNCLHEWKVEFKEDIDEDHLDDEKLKNLLPLPPKIDSKCPKCNSEEIYRLKKEIIIRK